MPIRADMGWCDAPADANYNRRVRLPFRAKHEKMLRDDRLYDVCIVLDWNIRPRRRNGGSAIYMH
jgi:L,D-peptidoglycan transpeptidase YkuD (ErfK/YbiS/YcfS/YnhG family)